MKNYELIFAKYRYTPSKSISSLILIGGRGSRLEASRKIITPSLYPYLGEYWGREGPKALAVLQIKGVKAPLIDWHMEIHAKSPQLKNIYLGLGFEGGMINKHIDHCHQFSYKKRPIQLLIEQNPAGTIAPLIKMFQNNILKSEPLIIANGDNLLEADLYTSYLDGLCYALTSNINPDEAVISLAAHVDYTLSDRYGVIDINTQTHLANAFYEKQAVEKNPCEMYDGRAISWINSGFSIIVNPLLFVAKYVSNDIISISHQLECGKLDYKTYEKKVKYESLYEKVALLNRLVVVKQYGYWADSGSEELIKAIEQHYQ